MLRIVGPAQRGAGLTQGGGESQDGGHMMLLRARLKQLEEILAEMIWLNIACSLKLSCQRKEHVQRNFGGSGGNVQRIHNPGLQVRRGLSRMTASTDFSPIIFFSLR